LWIITIHAYIKGEFSILEITREHGEPIFVCMYKSICVYSSQVDLDLGEGIHRGKHEIMARGFSRAKQYPQCELFLPRI